MMATWSSSPRLPGPRTVSRAPRRTGVAVSASLSGTMPTGCRRPLPHTRGTPTRLRRAATAPSRRTDTIPDPRCTRCRHSGSTRGGTHVHGRRPSQGRAQGPRPGTPPGTAHSRCRAWGRRHTRPESRHLETRPPAGRLTHTRRTRGTPRCRSRAPPQSTPAGTDSGAQAASNTACRVPM